MGTYDNVAQEGLFGWAASGPPPAERVRATAPLAVRMRPRALDEVVGQAHLLRPGAPLRRLVEGGAATSVIMWGPPGTGKTTLAYVAPHATGRRFVELAAVDPRVEDVPAAT